jgi:hypothetical protein
LQDLDGKNLEYDYTYWKLTKLKLLDLGKFSTAIVSVILEYQHPDCQSTWNSRISAYRLKKFHCTTWYRVILE